ncbi:MAG: hypothetical protein AAF788_01560 [Pseudomonadota bacterium]
MPTASVALVFGLSAAVIAGLFTHAFCKVVIHNGFALDEVSQRSNHSVPTPRLGGASILLGLGAAAAVLTATGLIGGPSLSVLMMAFAAGAIGLADDLSALQPIPKLVLLSIVAVLSAVLLGPLEVMPIPFIGWVTLPSTVGLLLAAFWLLAIMNVTNFMDGLNGLVGSFFIIAVMGSALFVGGATGWWVLAAQAAALGFLFSNAFLGRIFLGDAGSLTLGFLMGAVPLVSTGEERGFWLTPLIVLPLISDVAITLVRRAARGARLTEPHRDHLYQRLKASGWSHQVVAIAVLTSGLFALLIAASMGPQLTVNPLQYWGAAILICAVWAALMIGLRALKPVPRRLEGTLR